MKIFLEAFQTRTVTKFPGTNNSEFPMMRIGEVEHTVLWCSVVFQKSAVFFSALPWRCVPFQYHGNVFQCSLNSKVCLVAVHCNALQYQGGVFRTIESSLHEIIGSRPGVPPRHASFHPPHSEKRQNIWGGHIFEEAKYQRATFFKQLEIRGTKFLRRQNISRINPNIFQEIQNIYVIFSLKSERHREGEEGGEEEKGLGLEYSSALMVIFEKYS